MIEILIVEDEKPISDLIRLNLMKAGYSCTCAFDGMEAADILEERNFDLIILDVMLPKLNGFELMEYIKPLGIPVIFLTAKATLDDRLRGLTSGAEDYMVKPFEMLELLLRIEKILKRTGKSDDIIELDDITIDMKKHIVLKKKEQISLTPMEYDLLCTLAKNRNIALEREKLLNAVCGYDYLGETNIIDVYVRYLRTKIDDRFGVKLITTVRGVGYVIRE